MTGTPLFGPPFAALQREIYGRGVDGVSPEHALVLERLAQAARERLSAIDERAADYLFGGAGAEDTMRANAAAFARWRLVPRVLRDVDERDLSVTVLGASLPAPVALAPVGVQTLMHPDGELASARAAAALGLPFTLSTVSGLPMEQVAGVDDGPKWFQLYWPTDRELAQSLVARAERAGYEAIVLTVDNFLPSWRPRDLQHAWLPFLHGHGIANYTSDPVFRARLAAPPEEDPRAAAQEFAGLWINPRLTWDDLELLSAWTSLPIAVKGILHPSDARAAADRGVDAIVVSNHGGRQIDGEIASLDALPAIVDAVGGEVQILLDSGVRTGADVVKALALGADAVLVGRPYAWGLAAGGEGGVLSALRCLLAELDVTLGLCGQTSIAGLERGLLVREGEV
ncbi:MAG: alpha-hydroxy-acid oxidizing protein [Solirubrobacteraceae bacterium]